MESCMDLFKNNVVAGVGLAFAASVLAPIMLPAMGRIGRPLAKSLVRGGMTMYEKGREAVAVAGESVEDLMAEIRAEARHESATAMAPRHDGATPVGPEHDAGPSLVRERDTGAAVAPEQAAAAPPRPYAGNGADGAAPPRGASGADAAGNI
jgi:hypothetical protein